MSNISELYIIVFDFAAGSVIECHRTRSLRGREKKI
jgi:hypothetical protein